MIESTDRGLYCAAADIYIDPWQPVDRALVTHAHADHARPGSAAYLCAAPGLSVLRRRLGNAAIEGIPYGESRTINGVRVSFHPAGHILGSAQVRMEHRGEVWVVSGDYKRAPDPTCAAFEPVACDTFVTEATFALPVYTWDPAMDVIDDIVAWWNENRADGRASVLFCYVLGKAQRILALLHHGVDGSIRLHGAMEAATEAYREAGVELATSERIREDVRGKALAGTLVLAPLAARGTTWMRRLPHASTAFASGLMRVRGVRRQRAFDRGFVLSDHADWPALLATIAETRASRVLATHGWSDALARYLAERGLETGTLRTAYEGEPGELTSTSEEQAGAGGEPPQAAASAQRSGDAQGPHRAKR
jgi:putative mRNA 3-end processing factor